jgi:hypothetical protein
VRADDVDGLSRHAARQLAVRALPQQDRIEAEPVWTSAERKPSASASAPMKIITVSLTPNAVVNVDTDAASRSDVVTERNRHIVS